MADILLRGVTVSTQDIQQATVYISKAREMSMQSPFYASRRPDLREAWMQAIDRFNSRVPFYQSLGIEAELIDTQ